MDNEYLLNFLKKLFKRKKCSNHQEKETYLFNVLWT